MSDAGVQSWDFFYLSSDTSSGLQSTLVGGSSGDIGTGIYDNTGNTSILGDVANDTLNDDYANGGMSETYIGQATVDGYTVFFASARLGGNNVIIAYGPHGVVSLADVQSINPASITNTPFDLPCFVAGTMIRTANGDRAVEQLRAGDLVVSSDGAHKPVQWVGRSTKATLFADPARTLPVRIKAGALGENLPVRDLLVSPGHAMLVEGVLVHAGAMVNGTSILRETNVPAAFTYYHVETGAHDLLLAEGAATESFLAGVEDMAFDNWDERPAEAGVPVEMAYPRVKAARQLPASVRQLLSARAAAIAPVVAAAA